MKNSMQSGINRVIQLNYSDKDGIWLLSGRTLRRLIGILGMLLPLLLWLYLKIDYDLNAPLESISHYYFTRAASIFIIILSLLAMFLIITKEKRVVS